MEGGVLLEREPSLRNDVMETGPDAGAEPVVGLRDGARFRRWIRDRAAGSQRAADYFVPEGEVVRGPATVRQPYRFSRTGRDCAYPNETVRWFAFERGESVNFGIQQGGQPGLGEASTRQAVSTAMRAWNRDPQSRVDLRYDRPPAPPEADAYRGRNLIMFDDPFNEMGELEPDGGAVGWATTWWACNSPPVPRPSPHERYADVQIVQSDVNTRRGLGDHLRRRYSSEAGRRVYMEELLGHELGHSLGIAHPCDADATHDCNTEAKREALMYPRIRADGRGARLSSDDQEILRLLYGLPVSEPPPAAPTGVRATPTSSTTVHIVWTDRSDDEDGFMVWKRLEGADWNRAVTTSANAQEASVSGLRPEGRYSFLVRVFRGDVYADSDSVVVTMPGQEAGTLQGAQFDVEFSATANDSETVGRAAEWSSDKGVLYWLFDSGNPEALVKVLNGTGFNGHWWLDLAVASDLPSAARVTHRGTGDEWVAMTGFGRDVYIDPGDAANRLVHCARPASRTDNGCAVSGYGTTISLRDAWDSSGRIPSKYLASASVSAARSRPEAPSLPGFFPHANGGAEGAIAGRDLLSANGSQVTAGLADHESARLCCPGPLPVPASTSLAVLSPRRRTGPDFGGAGRVVFPPPASAEAAPASTHQVRATLGDLRLDADFVALTVPGARPTEPGNLQDARFDIHFSATANDTDTVGTSGWSSDQGVLYWLFDPQNPEALVKVLDGTSFNGHWWFDLAVASDLRSTTRVIHRETGEEWVAITGFGRDVYLDPGAAANRLVHCAYPAGREDNRCAVSGYGTTISLRDAWDSSGRIPQVHHD